MFKNKEQRDSIQKKLLDNGVACQIYYPQSLHLQSVYRELGYKPGDFPISEKAQDCTLSLPMYPELGDEQINSICALVKEG
jgi:dTDP-4-amino-4,6-dideoxygalactose transaminase